MEFIISILIASIIAILIYLDKHMPGQFKMALSILMPKILIGILIIVVSAYCIFRVNLFQTEELFENLLKINISLVFFLIGLILFYYSVYDIVNNNIVTYSGELKVIEEVISSRGFKTKHRFIIFYNNKEIKLKIPKSLYREIKDIKFGKVRYYGRTNTFIDIEVIEKI